MLKKVLAITLVSFSLQAGDMHTLLEGVKHNYTSKLGTLNIKSSENALDLIHSQLYPKIGIFASASHYNSPSNLRPVTPSENEKVAPNLPFSQDIYRIGTTLSMPIFVKSLYTLADKAILMQKSAYAKKRVDVLKDEATVVGSNANLIYLQELERALNAKRKTLKTTEEIVKVKVNSGRAPRSALFKVQDKIDQIDIAINSIEIQKENIFSIIKTLSGINLHSAVRMKQKSYYRKRDFLALQPLKAKNKADILAIRAEREKLYPSLYLNGNFSRGYGESYLSHNNIQRDYGDIGISLKMPLFDMPKYKNIEKARINAMKSATLVAKTSEELKAKANAMSRELRLLKKSIRLNLHNISNQKKLLNIAKTSYDNGRMTLEEYLRYIDDLFDAKANLYKSKAQYWQILAQIAFIYGNDLENIVK